MTTKNYEIKQKQEEIKRKPLETGSVIKGNKHIYKLESYIGKGGTSLVYRARTNEGLVVILKEYYPILNKRISRENSKLCVPEELKDVYVSFMEHEKRSYELSRRFIAENRKSNDPHSWNYIEAFEENNTYYQVCQDVEGNSLDKILRDRIWKLESMNDYVQLGLLMISAVRNIHNMGYVHCDLKPENMYVVSSNPPIFRCIDFGSAVPVGSMKIISSTYRYAAPQINFDFSQKLKSVDILGGIQYSFDIYSILAILYQEITGKIAKERKNRNAALFDRKTTEFVNVESRQLLNISDEAIEKLNRVFKKGMEPTKGLSYGNLEEFEKDLLEIQSLLANKVYLHSISKRDVLPRINSDDEERTIFKKAIDTDITLTYFAVEKGEDYLKTCAQFFKYCEEVNRKAKLAPVMFRNSLKNTLLALPFGTEEKEVQEEDLFAKLARLDESYFILILGYQYNSKDADLLDRLSSHKYTKYFFFGEELQWQETSEKFGKVFHIKNSSSEQKLITNFNGIPLKYFISVPNYGINKAVLHEISDIDMGVVDDLCREENLYKFGDMYFVNPKLFALSQKKIELNDEMCLEIIRVFLRAAKKDNYWCINQYQKFTRNDLDICKELLLKTKCSQESADTLSEIYCCVDKERLGGVLKNLYEDYFKACQNETRIEIKNNSESKKEETEDKELRNYLYVLGNNVYEFASLFSRSGNGKKDLKNYRQILFELTKQPELLVQNYFDSKQFDKVVETTTMLIELFELYGEDFKKSIEECYEQRAKAYFKLEEYINAEKDYTKLIQRGVKTYKVCVGRANVYNEMKKYKEAENDYLYAIKKNNKDASVFVNLGTLQIRLRKFENAAESIERALDLDPDNAWAWWRRGELYERTGNYKEAEKSYLMATEKDETKNMFWVELAALQVNLNKCEEAEKNIRKALELEANDGYAWCVRGNIFFRRSDYINAEKYYLESINRDDHNSVFFSNLVRAQIKLKKWKQAETNILIAIKLDSKSATVLETGGDLYYSLDDLEKAKELYKAAIKLNPWTAESWNKLGKTYYKQYDYLKSEECLEKALKMPNVRINCLYDLAKLKCAMHKWTEAEGLYRRIINIDSTYHQAWNGLGDIYSDQGDLKTALHYYEQALKLDPNNEVYKEDVAITREELGLQ